MMLAPAKALGLLVRNLCVSREPIYALGEWAAPFDPLLLGLTVEEVASQFAPLARHPLTDRDGQHIQTFRCQHWSTRRYSKITPRSLILN